MSQYRPADRFRQEREAAERQMKRRFWIGLAVPAIACAVAALLIGPDSWLGWAAVIAVAPAAAAGVAITFMLQDRR
jgi:uncharacterized membrane protein YdbT with pleckstrin-like domain